MDELAWKKIIHHVGVQLILAEICLAGWRRDVEWIMSAIQIGGKE